MIISSSVCKQRLNIKYSAVSFSDGHTVMLAGAACVSKLLNIYFYGRCVLSFNVYM